MPDQEKTIQIIANESNTVFEVEAGELAQAERLPTMAEKQQAFDAKEASLGTEPNVAERTTDEVATNDGAVIETLDTAFHNKPGVAEGENLSGSSRADYYKSRSQGKTDAEEELDELNKR